jgi:tetrahydromethanopterin S-methyltransferase subunit A
MNVLGIRLGSRLRQMVITGDQTSTHIAGQCLKPACDIYGIADDCELQPGHANVTKDYFSVMKTETRVDFLITSVAAFGSA